MHATIAKVKMRLEFETHSNPLPAGAPPLKAPAGLIMCLMVTAALIRLRHISRRGPQLTWCVTALTCELNPLHADRR